MIELEYQYLDSSCEWSDWCSKYFWSQRGAAIAHYRNWGGTWRQSKKSQCPVVHQVFTFWDPQSSGVFCCIIHCFVSGILGQCVGQDIREDIILLWPTCPKTSVTNYLLTLQFPRRWRTWTISWQKTKLANTLVGCPVCNASCFFFFSWINT